MNNDVIVTLEILVVIVGPLLFLYLKGKWPLGKTIPSLLVIPVLWHLTYAPLHELSHVAGTYLVGGKVVYIKFIPRFWRGEFGQAWITPEGLSSMWQKLIMTAFPYLLDAACVTVGYFLLRRKSFKNPFVIGFLLMSLCLRPTFDLICETGALIQGRKAYLFNLASVIGGSVLWMIIFICIGLSVCSIVGILAHLTKLQKYSLPPAT